MPITYFKDPKRYCEYPGSLRSLSMECMGKLVSVLLERMVKLQRIETVYEVCDSLQQMLQNSKIPGDLSSELKVRMLRHLENSYKQLSETYEKEEAYNEIATEFFIAIMQNSAKKIECLEFGPHPEELDGHKMAFADMIYNALPKLNYVEAIILGKSIVIGNVDKLNDFLETSTKYSIDVNSGQISDVVVQRCKNIRILCITPDWFLKSQLAVPFILKLGRLEEIHVPDMQDKSPLELMKGLAASVCYDEETVSQHMRRFTCDSVLGTEGIQLLGNKFYRITSLKLVCEKCDLTPLKSLKSLKHLSIGCNSFGFLKTLLTEVGNQLSCLGLRNVADANLHDVLKLCPFVSCLHLESSPSASTYKPKKGKFLDSVIPDFLFVQELELDFVNKDKLLIFIMSHFKHVRKLYFSNCISDTVLEAVIRTDQLGFLEVAFFRKDLRFVTVKLEEKYAIITDVNRTEIDSIPTVSVRSIEMRE